MASPCYFHPTMDSIAACIQCGMPICGDCREQVGERSACRKCAPAFKARMAQQMVAVPAGSQAGPANYRGYAPNPLPAAYGGNVAIVADSGAKEMALGIGLALVVGIIGAVIIEKILFQFGFGLSLLYVGLGYGIGWSIHRVTGRGGAGMALMAVGIMVVCLGISHLVYAQDVLTAVRAAGNADASATLFDAIPVAMSSLGVMNWVCIAFGLMACYRGMEAQQN